MAPERTPEPPPSHTRMRFGAGSAAAGRTLDPGPPASAAIFVAVASTMPASVNSRTRIFGFPWPRVGHRHNGLPNIFHPRRCGLRRYKDGHGVRCSPAPIRCAGGSSDFIGCDVDRDAAVLGQAKSKYAGTTLRGAAFSLPFHEYLRGYFSEFEDKTGIKVAFDIQAFRVYNQRMDRELSTRGSTYDVIIVTFIYQNRWIGAGWVSDLDEYTSDANATPGDWDPADFVPGVQASMRDPKGHTYAYGVEAGAMILTAARSDLIEKTGRGLPATFDDVIKVCETVHNKEGVAAWTADKLHHWNWIPYLMGMGGGVFKDPPQNLTPTLDTPTAARAAQWYADLLTRFGPDGVLSYTDDQAMQSQLSGRANMRSQAITWGLPPAKNPDSTVKHTVRYGLVPAGPACAFPGVACHGFGIPAGSRKKGAA